MLRHYLKVLKLSFAKMTGKPHPALDAKFTDREIRQAVLGMGIGLGEQRIAARAKVDLMVEKATVDDEFRERFDRIMVDCEKVVGNTKKILDEKL